MFPRTAIALGLVSLVAFGCSTEPANKPSPPIDMGTMPSPFVAPAIVLPPVRPAAEANLPDDETVVGVVVSGGARAYLLKALSPVSKNVVNDLIGDTPVSVTYFARTNCVRVFTDVITGKPLDIRMGGYSGGMLLLVEGSFFQQESSQSLTPGLEFPYRTMSYEETTWGSWKQAHPESEVYTGDLPANDIRRPEAGP